MLSPFTFSRKFLRPLAFLTGAVFLMLIAVVSGSAVTHASTLTVVNTSDSGAGSLRQAIIDATSGDTVGFDAGLSGQTITLTSGELDIGKDLTITGPAGGIIVSGNNASRVFNVPNGMTVNMSYLTISNGSDAGFGGGGIYNLGTLSLTNSTVTGNSEIGAYGYGGGGIYTGGRLRLANSSVTGNSAVGGAGGINNFGLADLSNVTVSGNTSTVEGGGIWNSGTNPNERYGQLQYSDR